MPGKTSSFLPWKTGNTSGSREGLISVLDQLRLVCCPERPSWRCPGLLVTGSDILERCLSFSYRFEFHRYMVVVERRGLDEATQEETME